MSEMVGMLAVTVTMIAMNIILMAYAGADGVTAAAILFSAQTILSAAYGGYVQGIAPVISFHFGKGNDGELKKLYRIALKTVSVLSVLTFLAVFPTAKPIVQLFADGAEQVIPMAMRGIYISAVSFLFMGFNLFASGFFTALNDGKTSAVLSLFRTLIFLLIPLLIFPGIWGVDGVWLCVPAAEILSILLSVFYFRKMKSRYHYA